METYTGMETCVDGHLSEESCIYLSILAYGMVSNGVVWCGVVWCGMVWCGMYGCIPLDADSIEHI